MRLNRKHQVTPHAWAAYDDVRVRWEFLRPAGANLPMITGRILPFSGRGECTGAQASCQPTVPQRAALNRRKGQAEAIGFQPTPRRLLSIASGLAPVPVPDGRVCARARAHAENTRRTAADGSARGPGHGPSHADVCKRVWRYGCGYVM